MIEFIGLEIDSTYPGPYFTGAGSITINESDIWPLIFNRVKGVITVSFSRFAFQANTFMVFSL